MEESRPSPTVAPGPPEPPTCQMEPFSRDGLCGKPAAYRWTPRHGKVTLVCGRCILSVWLCGGEFDKLSGEA